MITSVLNSVILKFILFQLTQNALQQSGSLLSIVGDLQNRIIHTLATHLVLKHYYNIGFCHIKVNGYDPKVGFDPTLILYRLHH